ncbi:MAG: hypothetical protein HC905_05905 [Bacteroidales bacterium]|nr:hypothetical protein [Bacteroidales bacterium]
MQNGPDNIYWLFSSSAQSIAAFTGFLTAGLFFAYERLDKAVELDETLEEINNEIKNQYYRRIFALLVLTGISIASSLSLLFLNGYQLGYWLGILTGFVGLINFITIALAIFFCDIHNKSK